MNAHVSNIAHSHTTNLYNLLNNYNKHIHYYTHMHTQLIPPQTTCTHMTAPGFLAFWGRQSFCFLLFGLPWTSQLPCYGRRCPLRMNGPFCFIFSVSHLQCVKLLDLEGVVCLVCWAFLERGFLHAFSPSQGTICWLGFTHPWEAWQSLSAACITVPSPELRARDRGARRTLAQPFPMCSPDTCTLLPKISVTRWIHRAFQCRWENYRSRAL